MSSSGWAFNPVCVRGRRRLPGRAVLTRVGLVALVSARATLASAVSASAQTFTTTSSPTGPGVPIIPPQNPGAIGIFSSCSSDAECLADAHGVRATQDTQMPEKAGAVVSYSDSQASVTTFTVEQQLSGGVGKGGCVAPPSHKRKGETACIRYQTLGSCAHADAAGANRFRFMGRFNGGELKPGAYLMIASPRNRAGLRGATVKQAFKVVR